MMAFVVFDSLLRGKMPKKIVTTTGAAHRDDTSVAQLELELRANEERWGAVMANPFMGITVLDHNHYLHNGQFDLSKHGRLYQR